MKYNRVLTKVSVMVLVLSGMSPSYTVFATSDNVNDNDLAQVELTDDSENDDSIPLEDSTDSNVSEDLTASGEGNDYELPSIEAQSSPIELEAATDSVADETGILAQSDSLSSGTYGTSEWTYNSDTQTMVIGTGEWGILSLRPWAQEEIRKSIKKIEVTGEVILPSNSTGLFDGMSNLEEISGTYFFNTSNVTQMRFMFRNTSNLTSLDVSNWDTSNVVDMFGMFDAVKVTELNVSNWNTSKVTDMSNMFAGADNLANLDVSNWDMSNVVNTSSMFYNASNLVSLDVSNWNTSKVITMWNMFFRASNLTNLDVSNWDTSNVSNMESMFSGAASLANLDVSNWNTSKVTRMRTLFYGTRNLTSLDISNWNMSNVSSNDSMFSSSGLREIALGSNVFLTSSMQLNSPPSDSLYTGNWQAVENGTTNKPKGHTYTTAELISLYPKHELNNLVETYVWEIKGTNQINVHDSTINVGDEWTAENNFDDAYDKYGDTIPFDQLTVDASKVDIKKAGVYEVSYTFEDTTAVAIVTVERKEYAVEVNVHDSTINVGDEWIAENNFDDAYDRYGDAVPFDQLTVDASRVDVKKAGVYEVSYTFEDTTAVATVTVERKEYAVEVNVHDSTINVGDEWTAENNLDDAYDKYGDTVPFDQLTVDASKVDVKKAGVYEVSYTFEDTTAIATITVKGKKAPIKESPTSEGSLTVEKNVKPGSPQFTTNAKKHRLENAQSNLPSAGENKTLFIHMIGILLLDIGLLMVAIKRKDSTSENIK
ncbi:BspA family leucine-rich repeat surface protein [Enterococcus wangshanyuanii]|uniref:Ig-like domain-containing protein n=2 Tax=Enterococcus wangshanyuanii TaxID=2005703 RepID=A0ABQ1PSU4_9ENTE|nr:BspA family leucine-rich repeat surface protein [Enterococcus wangshanyuanii]GGD02976.1 hypothetical protein GCM10011573_35560 [Enterococcus wangshanyuanii]